MDDESHLEYLALLGDPDFAGPTRPLHLRISSWEEETHRLEDRIREQYPFSGRWQSIITPSSKLLIPKELQHLFADGGVISVSTNHHLILYGKQHWQRMERKLAKDIGLEPVHNDRARHLLESLYRFDGLDKDGAVDVSVYFKEYANIKDEVVIIGTIFHAEVHDRKTYMETQTKISKDSLLQRIKNIKK